MRKSGPRTRGTISSIRLYCLSKSPPEKCMFTSKSPTEKMYSFT